MHSTMTRQCHLQLMMVLCVATRSSGTESSASRGNELSYKDALELEDESLTKGSGTVVHRSRTEETAIVRHRRTAVLEENYLWPNATIPYILTDPVEEDWSMKKEILESIGHWHERTCIRFVQHSSATRPDMDKIGRYVEFVKGTECHSSVGRRAYTGSQSVSLSLRCAYRATIVHELGHLVGLWHEHARYDRDNHVIILWNNIEKEPDTIKGNFYKQKSMKIIAPYDLSSIMHYTLKTFSASNESVIQPIVEDLQFFVGERPDLSFYDGYTVNTLYNCSGHCSRNSPKCQNSGYLDKNCECVCPPLLKGPTCDETVTDDGCGGVVQLGNSKISIKSPRYPGRYPAITNCTWLLKSPPGSVMLLYIEDLDIAGGAIGTCKDYLEIQYHYIGIGYGPMLCGNKTHLGRKEFTSTTERMILKFHSDSTYESKGFHAIIKVLPKSDCASSPCKNGATCEDILQTETYFCNCSSGWIGRNCELQIRDGRWSEWSAWSNCTAQCGVNHRSRQCHPPINGGLDCVGSAQQSRRCSEGGIHLCDGHFFCDVGTKSKPDDCGMVQNATSLRWLVNNGPTRSRHTGPKTGHTTGELDDAYYYMEANDGSSYENVSLWLPSNNWKTGRYCLEFYYHMFGQSMGQLRLQRRTRTHTYEIWQESNNLGDEWHQGNVNVLLYDGVAIGFEATRGNSFNSDIAIDDISISPRGCDEGMVSDEPSQPPQSHLPNDKKTRMSRHGRTHACVDTNQKHRVGKFTRVEGCKKFHCFCNQNGKADCPSWKFDGICRD